MTYPFDGAKHPDKPEPSDAADIDAADYRDVPTAAELGRETMPYRSDAELQARADLLADKAGDDPWTYPENALRFNPNPR
jgi:hypothetical protein